MKIHIETETREELKKCVEVLMGLKSINTRLAIEIPTTEEEMKLFDKEITELEH